VNHDFPIYASLEAGMTDMCHQTQILLVEMGSLNFCLGLSQTMILLLFNSSPVARITGMSHCTWKICISLKAINK
jgi:hypothetical protein